MLRTLKGTLTAKHDVYIVVDVHGVGLRVNVPQTVFSVLPKDGAEVQLYTHMHVREDAINLYGFLSERELNFFEILLTVSGVGPKIAIAVMSVAPIGKLSAAIASGDAAILQKSFGIGKKTAERIVMELKEKLDVGDGGILVRAMEVDHDVLEALVSLGYTRAQAKSALSKVDAKITIAEERLRQALKIIKS
ncbi:MAG: Holliday junction branch migration protein RuvA [Candidatus Colwellbacteria bacterium]|nr:Holliday junction branch migration protein RuvA [Candidatus Colwellbacteria bacterium]